jgi:acylphosphatase
VSEPQQQQYEVYYAGTVQGVGFRYTVRALAARFDVTGFVRNLPDGRVHLAAEGADDEVRKFLDSVRAEMRHCIRDVQETVRPTAGRFHAFEIRH